MKRVAQYAVYLIVSPIFGAENGGNTLVNDLKPWLWQDPKRTQPRVIPLAIILSGFRFSMPAGRWVDSGEVLTLCISSGAIAVLSQDQLGCQWPLGIEPGPEISAVVTTYSYFASSLKEPPE
jgi:hypothetical protein